MTEFGDQDLYRPQTRESPHVRLRTLQMQVTNLNKSIEQTTDPQMRASLRLSLESIERQRDDAALDAEWYFEPEKPASDNTAPNADQHPPDAAAP